VDLYVLRHAIAADYAGYARDADRPLTAEGIERLRHMIRAWPALAIEVDQVVSSPYLRARQTAEIAAEALGASLEIRDTLACGARPRDILDTVTQGRAPAGRAMVVGHEPDLGMFVAWLTSGGARGSVRMKKGGLAKLTVDSWRDAPVAQLQWLLWPRHMIAMAGD
jgi:phosphohistidine phosphatase